MSEPSHAPQLNSPRMFFLVLTLFIGAFLLYPSHNYQHAFDTGDNGRDLYAFEQTMHGAIPYKDYSWFYGPLMPFVYALFNATFGVQISSIILGKLFLTLLAAVFLFLALSEVFAPLAAFAAAIWFLIFQNDFFYTYNHIGGIAAEMAVVWALLAYVRSPRTAVAFAGLFAAFILCLIKVNFGIVAAVMCVLCFWLTNRCKNVQSKGALPFYLAALLVPVGAGVVHWACVRGLSVAAVRQCLPYLAGDEPNLISLFGAAYRFVQILINTISANEVHLAMGGIAITSVAYAIFLLLTRRLERENQMRVGLALVLLTIFYVANYHEFVRSGVWYRLWWSQPIGIALIFGCIAVAAGEASINVRRIVSLAIGALVLFSAVDKVSAINRAKTPQQFLATERAQIYVGNDQQWIQTVEATTHYLRENLKPNERFFALPYDALYYYLTERQSPTRHLIFFDHIKINTDQEKEVISALDRHAVNHVLISSRSSATEHGMGTFGKTNCQILGRYIDEHFIEVARFGNWTDDPGWGWNHGTKILRRKAPLPANQALPR